MTTTTIHTIHAMYLQSGGLLQIDQFVDQLHIDIITIACTAFYYSHSSGEYGYLNF